jgi:cell division protein FtsW (lipid II flippase)
MIVLLILFTLLWAGGAPKVIFIGTLLVGIVGVLVMAAVSPNRMGRINSWLGRGGADDAQGTGLQAMQAKYALASGGWFGVGLGQSRSKWSYIPEAQNDFILSIIGEELGLIGTLAIVVLFIVLILSMYRVAHRSRNLYVRVVTVGVIAWLAGLHQHGHGHRPAAGDRRDPAVHLLRRFLAACVSVGRGARAQRCQGPDPPWRTPRNHGARGAIDETER